MLCRSVLDVGWVNVAVGVGVNVCSVGVGVGVGVGLHLPALPASTMASISEAERARLKIVSSSITPLSGSTLEL